MVSEIVINFFPAVAMGDCKILLFSLKENLLGSHLYVTSYYNALVDTKCRITKRNNFYTFTKYQYNKIANIDNIFAH